MGLVGLPVDTELSSALVALGFREAVPLTVEPGQRTAEETYLSLPLLVPQNLDTETPRGVIGRHVNPLVASSRRGGMTSIAGDAVTDQLEPGQHPRLVYEKASPTEKPQLYVDMDHVARLPPLIPLQRRFGIQVPQPVQAQAPHHPSHGLDRLHRQPGDPAESAALVPEVHGLLESLRIKHPQLAAAHTPSIGQ